ncbi:MAG: NUDIX hydrolase [Bacilli bacterium]|nr:NUDIX hydrolase [Bacilli bacterium]
MLFNEEVKNIDELIEKVLYDPSIKKMKVCVVCMLYDKDGKIVLHRRGAKARDEIGKLEAIGGSVDKSDGDFRDALLRELREEAGLEATFEVGKFVVAQHTQHVDKNSGELIDWIVLCYEGRIVDGELVNMEPDRCVEFTHKSIDDYLEDKDLSNSCYNFLRYIKDNR